MLDIHIRNPRRKKKVSTRYDIRDVDMSNVERPVITTRCGKRFSLTRNNEEGAREITQSSSILHTIVGFTPRSAHPLQKVPESVNEPDFG